MLSQPCHPHPFTRAASTPVKNPLFPLTICVHAKSLLSCLTLCDPMDYSPPGFSLHRILQARILEWVTIPFSRGIFPTQGSNPHLYRLLHWLAGSLPLAPLRKPIFTLYEFKRQCQVFDQTRLNLEKTGVLLLLNSLQTHSIGTAGLFLQKQSGKIQHGLPCPQTDV